MRELSFRRATALSLLMHVGFMMVALAATLKTSVRTPSVYTVRIVTPEAPEVKAAPANRQRVAPKKKAAVSEKPGPAPRADDQEELKKHKTELLEKLKKKQATIYKQDRLSEIKEKLESEQASVPSAEPNLIEESIREKWVFPDIDIRGLEAVISITVMRNGLIRINRFERPSGNELFDRSTLKAINRTGRVKPPPFGEELDIGIRFIPDEE
jgi:outer membrane biosynthesis protein TonB